ncbi:MAG: hypothetical protein WA419_14125 [Silvibacterium sp.]
MPKLRLSVLEGRGGIAGWPERVLRTGNYSGASVDRLTAARRQEILY